MRIINLEPNAWGAKGSPIYGFCTMTDIHEGSKVFSGLSCAATSGGKQTVYYEARDDFQKVFKCKEGCEKNVVKTLIFDCHGD